MTCNLSPYASLGSVIKETIKHGQPDSARLEPEEKKGRGAMALVIHEVLVLRGCGAWTAAAVHWTLHSSNSARAETA